MPLTDRATSRLGRALVDGFTSDRVVKVLARVRRLKEITDDERSVLKRASELVARIDKGDSILGREDTDRQTFGSSREPAREVRMLLRIGGDDKQIAEVQRILKALLQDQLPSNEDLKQAEAFFVEIGKDVLRRSQTIEGLPRTLGSFSGYA